uniref:Uncharacterized protein n=1 Tax=Alexandrium catenella TaxID=2925 RepID=A0A7S1QF54_ALECA
MSPPPPTRSSAPRGLRSCSSGRGPSALNLLQRLATAFDNTDQRKAYRTTRSRGVGSCCGAGRRFAAKTSSMNRDERPALRRASSAAAGRPRALWSSKGGNAA